MKTKRRRGPRFVKVSPLQLCGGEVLLYALSSDGVVWEKAPGLPWLPLPAGGVK